eukprot:1457538-Ditylum_brightwellii.AAC.1
MPMPVARYFMVWPLSSSPWIFIIGGDAGVAYVHCPSLHLKPTVWTAHFNGLRVPLVTFSPPTHVSTAACIAGMTLLIVGEFEEDVVRRLLSSTKMRAAKIRTTM